jgi:hypothetical protein
MSFSTSALLASLCPASGTQNPKSQAIPIGRTQKTSTGLDLQIKRVTHKFVFDPLPPRPATANFNSIWLAARALPRVPRCSMASTNSWLH